MRKIAKTGKKTFCYKIDRLSEVEEAISFANTRAERSNLRVHIEYKHDQGLFISISGPKDKINLFNHQLRDFIDELS